ncbi:NAD(P)/FAD-dependent oxidoreductase [Ramlibacter sp.]|uniref:NAD(P)/FAD-dependent oxidoreductase n=1 Tax=Ramlibacter sp. TaxID=1917967 RepID=UPI003D0B1C4F
MFGAYENPSAFRGARPRVAVVGSGIAGLATARALTPHAHVTLFEAASRFGGHAHTVEVTLDGIRHGVDTGFLVFNHRTYPGLRAMFEELGVQTAPSDMSFSVQAPRALDGGRLEWGGADFGAVFAQRRNLLRPRFWRMLSELLRFNRLATRMAQSGLDEMLDQSLGAFLDAHGFGQDFRDWYLLPMTACIWSMPTEAMLAFPAGTLIRFCHNHGLLQVADRPQWYTVAGGSARYVRAIVASLEDARPGCGVTGIRRDVSGAWLTTAQGQEHFDRVVIATHPDQALRLLHDASAEERTTLGAIRYQPNRAVLHTDAAVLPRRASAWSAWNYENGTTPGGESRVCLHYLIGKLQPLPWKRPVIVSLNPLRAIDPAHVVGEYDYDHPVFDAAALQAQGQLSRIQGRSNVWFCGAWTKYGFHEDGLQSGLTAARGVMVSLASAEPAARPAQSATFAGAP